MERASEPKKKPFTRYFTMCFQGKKVASLAELNRSKWRGFGYKTGAHRLSPIFELLIDLYDGKNIIQGLESCKINPDYAPDSPMRNDLDYYLPQLTNFMVFHQEIYCKELNKFLMETSKSDIYFAHSYYWHICSLMTSIGNGIADDIIKNIIEDCSKDMSTSEFLNEYDLYKTNLRKTLPKEDYDNMMVQADKRQSKAQTIIFMYKTSKQDIDKPEFAIKASDLNLKSYTSIDPSQSQLTSNIFTSNLLIFEDLYRIGEGLLRSTDKLRQLKDSLVAVNQNLPALVYAPFIKDGIKDNVLLNIVINETRVFSTKERAPFYICIEIFNPREELAAEYNSLFPEKVEKEVKIDKKHNIIDWAKSKLKFNKRDKPSPETNKSKQDLEAKYLSNEHLPNNMNQSLISDRTFDNSSEMSERSPSVTSSRGLKRRLSDPNCRSSHPHQEEHPDNLSSSYPHQNMSMSDMFDIENESQNGDHKIDIKSLGHADLKIEKEIDLESPPIDKAHEQDIESKPTSLGQIPNETELVNLTKEEIFDFFGEDSKDQSDKIRKHSIFGHLKTWKVVDFIFKTGADMKEEQFATQLISQFDQIFKAENLNLILTPYEIVSLGSDFGIVEMIKDSITMSRLKEKMYSQGIPSLKAFFAKYYGKDVNKARRRFCRSLAAYSLVCYFLQIKDRHNGNIMFHKSGHIVHIDFGFFLSNTPGKRLEFERKVPFKLLNEYIEVLGGPRSSLFQEFRKIFYQGFMAARKHKEQILILVKMMYSSQGNNLPCFKGGIRAIDDLEQRFCPPGVEEGNLKQYCYNLINQSLDNWRAKCYDTYQYHFQGIFY